MDDGDIDDRDLGSLLDATVPTAAASDAALARIHTRAGQRRRRAALTVGVVAVAIATAAAVGISSLGARRVAPAGSTGSNQGGTTTIVPDGRCFDGDVSLKIAPVFTHGPGPTRWAVIAHSGADTACRPLAPIKATIFDAKGHVLSAVAGTTSAALLPSDAHYVQTLAPDAATVVAYVSWVNPCSNGPVELDVNGFSPATARLQLPRQPCASGPISTSHFQIDGAVPTTGETAGQDCAAGAITLTIDANAVRTGSTVHWAITGTNERMNVVCRTHGVDAAIETVDGRVLTVIAGNPAVQNDEFQDLFPPAQPEFVDSLSWTNPCSDGPVVLVVSLYGGMAGSGARLTLPKQPCSAGQITTSHFQIDRGIPAVARSGSTTTAAAP